MLIDALLASTSLGEYRAPALKFFEPNSKFFRAMDVFRGTQIYDVGAGMGHVAAALIDDGHRVSAFDLGERDGQSTMVQLANGVTFPYEPGSVVMMCRPCHGPFVEAVIRHAVKCRVGTIIYAGLAKNVRGDLGGYYRSFTQNTVMVGRDRERLYVYKVSNA